ncbi:MFS transporter [Stenotrophomonas ginsengisoli]|uniref:MFS transporter n=1 Tax=Stenotrophomonas ginsengisoli TaxID=336566 RepID=A0A0R0DHG1_9GAMM|nr:MFS transporter [Stenotrophomonas ginsengisoli]KRG78178.1 MFS transporter [Stenotrophomonas ginsengisoli]
MPGSPRPLTHHGHWLALAAIVLTAVNLRTAVTSITPLLARLGEQFGFGTGMTGVFGMLPTAAFAVAGVLTPRLIGRLGAERTALLAMAISCAGLLLRAGAGSTTMLLLGSLLALAGMGCGNVVIPPLVKTYFPQRIGAVSALYLTTLQLGTMGPALAAVPLADAAGWRVSLGIWSLLAAAAVLPLWLLQRQAAPGQASASTTTMARPGKVWRTPLGWSMTLMFGMTSLISYAMFTWLPRLMTEAGADAAFGGVVVAVFSAMGLIASLAVPAIASRLRNPFILVAACWLLCLAAFAGLWLAPMKAPILWAVLMGLGPSTFPLSLTLINLRTRSPAGSAALSGFMQGTGYALACLGPLLFGLLFQATGSWGAPFALLAVASTCILLAGWHACRPQQLEDQWQS